MNHADYEYLLFERRDNGVLLITINRPEKLNAANDRLHWELGRVWLDVADDPQTRVALITGAGKAFCAGGDLEMVEDIGTGGFDHVATATRDAADIVNNIVNCDKPIVSAINGVAVGAGLAVALMADISIVAEEAKLTDGHLRIGVGAGDHAAIIWPLLCGMAKAKYLLMTAAVIDGREAERIGLVSDCVPRAELMEKAFAVADALGSGPQHALKWTKRSLNHWLRQATPIFEASLAYEMLTFMSDDAREGIRAVRENRPPRFPSAQD